MAAQSAARTSAMGTAPGRQVRKANTFPRTTAAMGEPPAGTEPIQRRPMTVSAQVTPASAARTLPRSGSGAVRAGASAPKKNMAIPAAITAMKTRSRRRTDSPSSSGPRSRTYRGAVPPCKKMVLAEVVSLLAVTNSTSVVA